MNVQYVSKNYHPVSFLNGCYILKLYYFYYSIPLKCASTLKSITIYIILLLLHFISNAQEFYFKNYQVNDGFSSNTITSILQDSKGFMWFGTRNGLNRFDGIHIKVYQSNPNDSLSIGNNSITAICEDSTHQLWIGTYKGIYQYIPQNESFHLIFPQFPLVKELHVDRSNNIWLIAQNKLYKADRNKKTQEFSSKSTGELTTFVLQNDNTIWVSNQQSELFKLDTKGNIQQKFNLFEINNFRPINTIQKLFVVNEHQLLVGTMNNLYLFDHKINNIQALLPQNIPHQVHSIIHEENSIYWVGTELGLYIVDLQNNTFKKINRAFANPYSLTDNVIYSLWKDFEGAIWIGTFFGGINYYSPSLNQFQKYYPNAGKNSISGNIVHEICEDDFGNIWIGTEDAGLNKINKATGKITSYLADGKPGSITYQNIHGLIAVGNELWVGTYEHGLDVLDINTGKKLRHYTTSEDPNSIRGNFIVSLYKSKKNDVYVGTWNGLSKYDRKRNIFIADTFFTTSIQSMMEDHNNIFWVGSYGGGVLWRNPQTGERGQFLHDSTKRNSLISNYVNNIYQDSEHNIWICTESGISKYHYNTQTFETINLFNSSAFQVFRIIEDSNKTFWITTSKGLVHYFPKTGKIKKYTESDGILSEQFNYNSSYQTKDGYIYLGTVKGMISFHPNQLKETSYIPPVYITNIQSNYEDIQKGRSIIYNDEIVLPAGSSNINIDVACLSYITPDKNEYLYKLEGVDNDWVPLKNNRTIYYNNLSPGTYIFTIKGSRNIESSEPSIRTIQIKILPPWYSSIWAYLVYILIIASIVYLIVRYYNLAHAERTKRKLAILESEKEREIHHAKIEFFTNIAHEIRTPLTLIKLPLDKLHAELGNHTNYYENISMMKKNTHRLIELTDQLLDFRKAEANKFTLNFVQTDINETIREIYQNFLPAAEQRNVEILLEIPRVSLMAYVDPEGIKKILTNLINNAIKYADKKIVVKLFPFYSDATHFEIGVKSDGYKIPESLREKIFEPFYRIKETDKAAGTGIGLALARSLAELHHGTLTLQHTDDDFNHFILNIPIHQEEELHIKDAIVEENSPLEEIEIDDSKIKLLIVEDQKEILRFLQKELKGEFGIYSAYNGQEALNILEKENIQIVISDIMMPIMDGIELTKRIKKDLQYSHIPVVLLTAKNTIHAKIEGLEAGADAYIEKPFSLEHLTAQLNNLLTNRNIIKEYFSKTAHTNLDNTKLSKADQQFIQNLHEYILDNINDPNLDVDMLSKLMNMSRATFYRKVKSISDLTPNELIMATRLKKAAKLLVEEELRIKEVVALVGYSNSSNFSRDFSKQFGMNPSQYVNENKK